jgi:predicted P-loop ATPase
MDTLVCLDKEDLQKIKDGTKQASKISEVLYRLENDATFKGLWNVVNEEGKAINEKPLEKAIAEELLTAING